MGVITLEIDLRPLDDLRPEPPEELQFTEKEQRLVAMVEARKSSDRHRDDASTGTETPRTPSTSEAEPRSLGAEQDDEEDEAPVDSEAIDVTMCVIWLSSPFNAAYAGPLVTVGSIRRLSSSFGRLVSHFWLNSGHFLPIAGSSRHANTRNSSRTSP